MIQTTLKLNVDLPNKPVSLNHKRRIAIPESHALCSRELIIRRCEFCDGTSYVKIDTDASSVCTATGDNEDIEKLLTSVYEHFGIN